MGSSLQDWIFARRIGVTAAFYLFMGMWATHTNFHRDLCEYRIFYKY